VKSWLTVDEAAEYLRISPWVLRARARRLEVPCRRPRGTRRYVFAVRELEAYLDGAPLEVVDANGGCVVRPKETS
jgi:hypothetical protein